MHKEGSKHHQFLYLKYQIYFWFCYTTMLRLIVSNTYKLNLVLIIFTSIPICWCILPNISKYPATWSKFSTWLTTLVIALDTFGMCFCSPFAAPNPPPLSRHKKLSTFSLSSVDKRSKCKKAYSFSSILCNIKHCHRPNSRKNCS